MVVGFSGFSYLVVLSKMFVSFEVSVFRVLRWGNKLFM